MGEDYWDTIAIHHITIGSQKFFLKFNLRVFVQKSNRGRQTRIECSNKVYFEQKELARQTEVSKL